MKFRKSETKVGIFVIIGLIIMVVGTSLVGNFKFLSRQRGYKVTAIFGSISGLEEKAPVRIAGVRVGEVERIYLKDGLAYVEMRLKPESVIREDSEVAVTSLGLLGEKYIEISSGSLDRPTVAAGETIHGKDVVSMDKLISQLTDIAEDIKAMTASLRSMFGPEEDRAPLRQLIDDFDSMIGNINILINENRANLNRAIEALADFATRAEDTVAENEQDIRETIKNLYAFSDNLRTQTSDITGRLASIADSLESALDGTRTDLASVFEEARQAARRIEETAASIKDIADRVGKGEGTIGKLVANEQAYDSFSRTMSSISQISERIDRGEGTIGKLVTDEAAYNSLKEAMDSVNRYITRGEEMNFYLGFRAEYLYDHEDYKSYYTMRIDPRKDKFYLLEVVDDPEGKFQETDILTTTTTDGQVEMVGLHEEKIEDKLKFTIQIGRRFDDLALRGGLMESSGGLGLDYWLLDDAARLTFEAFDFNREGMDPHLKAWAHYNFYKDLFISAGVDDLLESGRRTFFFGGGLLFSDEDIKYILSNFGG